MSSKTDSAGEEEEEEVEEEEARKHPTGREDQKRPQLSEIGIRRWYVAQCGETSHQFITNLKPVGCKL